MAGCDFGGKLEPGGAIRTRRKGPQWAEKSCLWQQWRMKGSGGIYGQEGGGGRGREKETDRGRSAESDKGLIDEIPC